MWYSNDEPPPTKFRQRTYTITCDNDLSEEDFELNYKWPIRSVNSQWPDCKFFIMAVSDADSRVEAFLRSIGVSPARIKVHHLQSRTPENKYHCETVSFDNILELEDNYVLYSTHDILWIPHYVPEGMTSRVKQKRAKKEKIQPFIDTEPVY